MKSRLGLFSPKVELNLKEFSTPLSTPTPTSIGLHRLTSSGINAVIGLCGLTCTDRRASNLHGGGISDKMGQAPEGQSLASTNPEKCLDYAHEWVACGATIIGGCCGITPEHIRTLTASNLRGTR